MPRYSERTADVGARDQSAPNDFEDPGAVSQPYRDTSGETIITFVLKE